MTEARKKLRELCLAATPGYAERAGLNPSVLLQAFHEAANPTAVLALLDALDSKEERCALLEAQVTELHIQLGAERLTLSQVDEQLAAMTAARDEACDLLEKDGSPTIHYCRISELRQVGQ